MSIYLAAELRQQMQEADDQRCAYCQTTQANSGYPMIVDHVVPGSKGGNTEFDNELISKLEKSANFPEK
jgi:5-methylcytosine-specific restriction endonuclease McrA